MTSDTTTTTTPPVKLTAVEISDKLLRNGSAESPPKDEEDPEKVDLFRDTAVRYLGYTNEVGEAFRAQVPVRFVHLSYVVATGYVIGDAIHKGQEAIEKSHPGDAERTGKVLTAVGDTFVWQGLASVAIPGFTINRICKFTNFLFSRKSQFPPATRKWLTTAVGLGCIPLIIKPIDRSVDFMLNNTLRKWTRYEAELAEVVHHKRHD